MHLPAYITEKPYGAGFAESCSLFWHIVESREDKWRNPRALYKERATTYSLIGAPYTLRVLTAVSAQERDIVRLKKSTVVCGLDNDRATR